MPATPGGATVNQHFVPRMYLKRFAAESEAGSSMLRVLSKADGRLFGANVSNVAVERYFYDGVGPQEAEGALAELEGATSPIIDRLAAEGEFQPLSAEESWTLATFVALLDVRTASFRRAAIGLAESIDGALRQMANALGTRHAPTAPQAPDEAREHHKSLMWTIAAASREAMASMQWTVLVAPVEARFVASDNPVVKYNPVPPPVPWMGNLGWRSPGLQVLLPLSPSTCLAIFDADVRLPGRARFALEGVRMANELQTFYAHRFIFGSRDDELACLEHQMQLDPSLREGGFAFGSVGLPLLTDE